jgi:hypothetical protein
VKTFFVSVIASACQMKNAPLRIAATAEIMIIRITAKYLLPAQRATRTDSRTMFPNDSNRLVVG